MSIGFWLRIEHFYNSSYVPNFQEYFQSIISSFQNGWVAFSMDKSYIWTTESASPLKPSHHHTHAHMYTYINKYTVFIPWLEFSLVFRSTCVKHLSKWNPTQSHSISFHRPYEEKTKVLVSSLSFAKLRGDIDWIMLWHSHWRALTCPPFVAHLRWLRRFCRWAWRGRGKFGILVDGGKDWMHSLASTPSHLPFATKKQDPKILSISLRCQGFSMF